MSDNLSALARLQDRVDQDALARLEVHEKPNGKTKVKGQAQIAALNEKHFVINNLGGKCLVGEFVPSSIDAKRTVLSWQSPNAFMTRYGNQKVGIAEEDATTTYKELGRYWLKHRDRRSYEGIELVPNGPAVLPGNRLNLWRGFGVTPKQGDYPRLKYHLNTILADGNPQATQYIWRWIAWAVQHPDEQAGVALVFRGLKGTGKGAMGHALRDIFGEHGFYINSPQHLVGNLNGHLEGCSLLFADEAFAVADKRSEGVLKRLLTEPVLIIERKGIDAKQTKNRLHVIMAANQSWVVPATGDERRFVVFQVSPARRGDRDYFAKLYAEIENGGLEALLYDLLHTDLADWHPREIYETDALREQKAHSLTPEEEWLEAVLQEGTLPGMEPGNRIAAKAALDDARERIPKLKYVSETAFGRFLRKQGCTPWRTCSTRGWQFPPLSEARTTWDNKFGYWPWDEPALTEWQIPE